MAKKKRVEKKRRPLQPLYPAGEMLKEESQRGWEYWYDEYTWAYASVADLRDRVNELLRVDYDGLTGLADLQEHTQRLRALAEFARLVGLSDFDGGGQFDPLTPAQQAAASEHWHAKFWPVLKDR